jgi:amidase
MWPILSRNASDEEFAAVLAMTATLPAENPLAKFARIASIPHREWLAVNEQRERLRAQWASFFRDYDVLLCPIVPTAAFPHDHTEPIAVRTLLVNGKPRPYIDVAIWAGVVTMALLPATLAPVGRTKSELPVGLQVVGAYLEDRTTIDFAARMADVVGGFEAPPNVREEAA